MRRAIRITASIAAAAGLALPAGAILVPVAAPRATPAADCQPYGLQPCLLPFPDNRLTRGDHTTPTGRR